MPLPEEPTTFIRCPRGSDTEPDPLHELSLILTASLCSGYYFCSSLSKEGGRWGGVCGIMISLGVGMITVRFRGQGVASVPLRGELNRNNQLCGVWSLGFGGRCLLAQQGSWQILFPWLIGHLFMLSPHSQNQATKRSSASTGGGQSKTKP